MTETPWTGTLRPGPERGRIVGELRDTYGTVMHIVGERQPDGTYRITADWTFGPALRVPGLDEPL